MSIDSNQRQALLQLGAATAEAVARTLELLAPGAVQRGEVLIGHDGSSPFDEIPASAVTASVSYVDGVTGANVFVMSHLSARALAGAMGVPPEEGRSLTELEMSALGEAANQTLAAAAAAISVVLGQEIEISPPEVRSVEDTSGIAELYPTAPYSCATTFAIAGESCRLIQLVPSAFVARMARAIEERSFEIGTEPVEGTSADALDPVDGSVSVSEALTGTQLRVWAELGRAEMPLGQALELPGGALVELDRATDAPVDLFVNGLCFGHGRLLLTEDGEWAIEVTDVASASVRQSTTLAFAGLAGLSEPPVELNPIQKGMH